MYFGGKDSASLSPRVLELFVPAPGAIRMLSRETSDFQKTWFSHKEINWMKLDGIADLKLKDHPF
jgi:hypothetical protein